MIVGVQPGREFVAAFCVVPVEAGIGPFVGQGAMKSLHFSVGLWSVGPGAAVFDATKGVGEDVGAVAGSIVGQDFPYRNAAFCEPGVGPRPERGGGLLALVAEQFGVSKPGVPIERRVLEVVTMQGVAVFVLPA